LSQILEANAPSKYWLSPKACAGILRRADKRGKDLPEALRVALEQVVGGLQGGGNAYALTCHAIKGGDPTTDNYAYRLGEPSFVPEKAACLETTNHDYSRADGFTAVAFNWQEGSSGGLGMSDADTGGSPPVRVSQTLAVAHEVAGMLGGGSGQRGWSNDLDRSGAFVPESTSVVRRLTPVECCRLQGFPDDWNSEGIDAKGKRFNMADAPRYRQLGNAVTVNVANWLANNLSSVYADHEEISP
jgi:site-specific DNA-cytosine methylase